MSHAKTLGTDRSGRFFATSADFTHGAGIARELFFIAFAPVEGERSMKLVIHPVVHVRVHPTASSNSLTEKKLSAMRCEFWAVRGREVGWNDPTFSSRPRPKRFSGSFHPTFALEG